MRLQRLLFLLVAWTALGRTVAWAQCNPAGTTVTLDYSTRPVNESWINKTNTSVPATSSFTQVNTSAVPYASSDNGSTLATTANFNGVQTLLWTATEPNNAGSSTVTYTFSRAVSNLTVRVQDIDANFVAATGGILGTPSHGYTDEVTFTGANGGTAVTPTLTKVNTASTFVTVTGNRATGDPAVGGTTSPTDATVIATYGSPVTSITLRYRNVITATNLDAQAVGVDQLTWCRITPTASNVTTATVPSTASQMSIAPLVGTADGTPSYVVTTLPANGTLLYNSTGTTYVPVAAGQALTPDQAASLRYTPSATYTGTSTTFSYQTRDDAGLTSATTATYTIPLFYLVPCGAATTTLNFGGRTTGENWKTHAAEGVPAGSTATLISSGGYTSGATSTSTLQIGTLNNGNTLAWNNQYSQTANKNSQVTFTFSRAVTNFSVQIQDIDANTGFTDQVFLRGPTTHCSSAHPASH